MRRAWIIVSLFAVLIALPASAEAKDPKFKSIEAKRFTRAEGVELSPDFPELLYAELRGELQKSGLFEQILGEGEVVEAADAETSLLLEGTLLEYKKGSVAKEVIIGYGVGRRSLRAQISVHRRSNHEALLDKELKVRSSSRWTEKALAKFLAKNIAGEIKHQLKH